MNFIEGIDQSILGTFNNNLTFEENQNLFPFSLDESEIPIIKEDKFSLPKNLFITKKSIKEKIKHQKLLLEKRGLTEKEKKEIYLDKKEDLKRRNRESAQRSRDKKKLEFMQIIAENKKLKDEIYNINKKIDLLCSGCKNIFDTKNDNECINCTYTNSNNNIEADSILNSPSTTTLFSNLKVQKIYNFVLLSLFCLLCIYGLISNIPYDSISENNESNKQIRNLEENMKINYNNHSKNNISKIDDFFFKKQHINSPNKSKIHNNIEEKTEINNYKNEICEEDFFTSFQCKKTPFPPKISDDFEESNNDNNFYIQNKDNIYISSNNSYNKNLYFKLFVQSCNKDEMDDNHNNSINDYTHYIFSSDNNMCHDFYFFCQRTE